MSDNDILFDDWAVRREGVLKGRKISYIVCFVCVGILFLGSAVAVFFVFPCIVFFIIAVITLITLYNEWRKIKNSHLIIKSNQIEITDKTNKTYVFKVRAEQLIIELRHACRRGGGIIMRFYDVKGRMICEYEDMLNRAAPFQLPKTEWEKGIEELGVRIIDETEILKNRRVRK